MNKVLSKPDKDPSGAVVSIEPETGYVKALVGGRDFFGEDTEAKFDLATQGRRPAGSSFKPFVLAAALDKGIPLSRIYNAPSTHDAAPAHRRRGTSTTTKVAAGVAWTSSRRRSTR